MTETTPLAEALRRRYTTKAYDAGRRIPDATAAQLFDALRFSPSSVNSQPWHFTTADDAAGKARIEKAFTGAYVYNAPKVANASHVVVLSARNTISAEYLDALIEQEKADGRLADDAAVAAARKVRGGYVGYHEEKGDVAAWTQKQTYLAQGFLLLSAALLGVDATPMEGFDAEELSKELGLDALGLTPVVVVALGYRDEGDFNARLPKSRLAETAVFSRA